MSARGPITTTSGWDHPAGRHLTQTEKDEIHKLIKAGYSHREIGIRMGRGQATISRAAKNMSVRPAQAKRPWTAQEDAQLIHLANEGLSHGEIASAMHRNQPAIAYRTWFLRHRSPEQIRYQAPPAPKEPTPQLAPSPHPPSVSLPVDTAAHGPIGLPSELDIYSLWHRAMYRQAPV